MALLYNCSQVKCLYKEVSKGACKNHKVSDERDSRSNVIRKSRVRCSNMENMSIIDGLIYNDN